MRWGSTTIHPAISTVFCEGASGWEHPGSAVAGCAEAGRRGGSWGLVMDSNHRIGTVPV